MSLPVFVINPEEAANLKPGDEYRLGGTEGRHAAGAMRMDPGESLDLVDGQGTRLRATVLPSDAQSGMQNGKQSGGQTTEQRAEKQAVKNTLNLRILDKSLEPAADPTITLVQALAKGGRDEQAIEAAVELGVNTLIPWQADRSIVRWRDEKASKGQSKWQELVFAAAKQSRQSHIPTVEAATTSKNLAAQLRRARQERGAHAVVLHEGAQEELVTFLDNRDPGSLMIIVGPEGGISPEELAQLTEAGAHSVSLGARILRSSSAGPAAIAAINTVWKRW